MQYSSLDNTCISTAAAALLDQYTGLSGNTSVYETMLAELPSITYIETQQGSSWGTPACSLPQHPPFNESFDTLVQCAPPPEQTPSEPLSPRSNGFLEAKFYKPKVSEGSNHDSLLNG